MKIKLLCKTLIIVFLILQTAHQGAAQDPKLQPDNLRFTRSLFEKNHWFAMVTIAEPMSLRFNYDVYPEVRRIKFANGDAYAQLKDKAWVKSDDWGKTGKPVNRAISNQLNSLSDVVESPLNKPITHDPSQGGFIWKSIQETRQENCQYFTYEQTREYPRKNGVYPRFTFVKANNDTDGQLRLVGYQGYFYKSEKYSPINIHYDIYFQINVAKTEYVDAPAKETAPKIENTLKNETPTLQEPSPAGSDADPTAEARVASAVALSFANDYAKFANGPGSGYDESVKWIKNSPLCTPEFAINLAKLYAEGRKSDPEVGYGADAVIDSNGGAPSIFTLKNVQVDGNSARVVLVGDKSFPMVRSVLLVKQDNRWLVNASGALAKKTEATQPANPVQKSAPSAPVEKLEISETLMKTLKDN